MKLMSQMSCKNVKDKSQSKAAATDKWQIPNMQDILVLAECFFTYNSKERLWFLYITCLVLEWTNEEESTREKIKQMIIGCIQIKWEQPTCF